jgi:catechol 2,3-dioxygenase
MDTLADLEDFYNNLGEKGVEIKRVSNHSLSLGIYIEDPDGNGIEVYYETPRSEWYRQEKLFMHGDRPEVSFPGPWEKDLVPDGVSAKS